MAKKKPTTVEMPMDGETEQLLDDCEASWPTTKELAFVIDDPMEKLMEKAHNIFAGRHWDTLDGLALRIADACPGGVTEENFGVAEPVAGACKKFFSNVEKLRVGLKRPFLDAGKAVDDAARATIARAEPTLNPIIFAVKAIEDRKKREKEAREEADRKRIEDERLAAEKAHRDMIEAEQAAERKRLADERLALEAEKMAILAKADEDRKALEAKNKQANDELAELRKQMEQLGRTEVKYTPEAAKAIAAAPLGPMVAMDIHGFPTPPAEQAAKQAATWKPSLPPLFDDELPPFAPAGVNPDRVIIDETANWSPTLRPSFQSLPLDNLDIKPSAKFAQAELDSISFAAENASEFAKASVEVSASGDHEKVRDVGNAIMAFKDSIKRPAVVKHEARQAIELALFDLCEIGKRLQEWSMA